MKKTIILALLMLTGIAGAYAQATVGSDSSPKATLDVVAGNAGATTPDGIIAPFLTLAQLNAKQAQYTTEQTGTFVYITDYSGPTVAGYSDRITSAGYAYWDGTQWIMNLRMLKTFFLLQPHSFAFYEQAPVTKPLVCIALGKTPLTYQWYKIVDGNVTQPCMSADGTRFATNSFTPNAAKGPNRYYCVVSDETGKGITSEIAEVVIGCGAYTNSGWLAFMCHNLGASQRFYPFIPERALHGAKYRFGAKEASLTMVQDQANAGAISGWTTGNTSTFPMQTSGDWSTANNPCPTGWVLPSNDQWNQVINSSDNVKTYIGSWMDNATNYSSGVNIGKYLFLPAAGYRNGSGTLLWRGNDGLYWSSSNARYLRIYSNNSETLGGGLYSGLSVRCVSE